LKPVVVFVDEIDQMLSARSMSGQTASHEVEQRMLARLLEFMGDDRHRGEILWIGATNRPDLLDAAMLRRFDRVLPFMNPTLAQVRGLLSDLATVLGLRLEGNSLEWDGICETIHARNLSCDSIQKIIRHACEIAALPPGGTGKRINPTEVQTALADYIPNHDPNRYLFMCLHSLAAVSFVSDLPWSRGSEVPGEFQAYVTTEDDIVTGIDRLAIEQTLRNIPR
jgi:AAA+ superfamily predicted ATPase